MPSANYTSLSSILNSMNRWQTLSTIEEQYKVEDLDDALRTLKRKILLPQSLRKSTLRVFPNILEYGTAADHDEIAYIDNNGEFFMTRGLFNFTSLKDFYENPDLNDNDLADIWENGSRFLGIRYQNHVNLSDTLLDNGETVANWTASGDASSPLLDNVVFSEGDGSIKFTITQSSGTATMTGSFTQFSDSNYKKKYHFMKIYLAAAPTSLVLRFGNDSNNYLYSNTITTQFSGQAFRANDFNWVAFDLNTANTQGTISSSAFDYQAVVFNGASTGTYYIDCSYLKEWSLLDYWYYSKYCIRSNGATLPDQEYFQTSPGTYSTDTSFVGESEWVDVIKYEAELTGMADKENDKTYAKIKEKRDAAWADLGIKYPDLVPLITTSYYEMDTQYNIV